MPPRPDTPPPEAPVRHGLRLGLLVVALSLGSMLTVEGMNVLARQLLLRFLPAAPPAATPPPTPPPRAHPPSHLFSLQHSDLHPDRLFVPYLGRPSYAPDAVRTPRITALHTLLDLYQARQREDDNFTIRVIDDRTGRVLERFTLTTEQRLFAETDTVTWRRIDRLRTRETERLSKKYQQLGIPRSALTIKWGRANQVREARTREAAFIEYELRLARRYGLSLLATEIGTVETFNDDRLVSRAGARSRYQIMPYLLRRFGIRHYRLRTLNGRPVQVSEERHPLLTMEPAFLIMRSYVNAVGHELPGLSAYHAGPFNLFKIYQLYLTHGDTEPAPNVLDAFVWGLTDGFPTVSRRSSFRAASRGYVPAVYGSFRATEVLPIDTTQTLRADLVQLAEGRSISLRRLLDALRADLNWPRSPDGTSRYNRFRALNPHFALPPAADSLGVPPGGDVHLTARADGAPVRFFLPPGASDQLAAAGLGVLDTAAIRRFDHRAFAPPSEAERTRWDRAYETLVQDIFYFGFTEQNRARLAEIKDHFDALATADPSPYRQAQRQIIHIHEDLWQSSWWSRLARTTTANAGRLRAPVSPPDPVKPRNPAAATGTL